MSGFLTEGELASIVNRDTDSDDSFDEESVSDDDDLNNFVLDRSNLEDEEDVNEDADESNSDSEDSTSPPKAKKTKTSYTWQQDTFIPIVFDFDNSDSGVTGEVHRNQTELDYFIQHFDNDLLSVIVNETNRYYHQIEDSYRNDEKPLPAIMKKWNDVNDEEMFVFFALCMLMSQIKKHSINGYWAMDELIATPAFGMYMARDRFKSILRFLHFNNNLCTSEDRDQKIRPVIDHLNDLFRTTLVPFENLCIDESLVLFKGRLSFKQFNPKKRNRFGIKLYMLCDSKTGYVLKIVVYLGSRTRIPEIPHGNFGKSGEVVVDLLKGYLNKGHSLYVDNWYTSPTLFAFLHSNQTNACGAVKQNRNGMEKRNCKKMVAGQIMCSHTGIFMYLTWMDKKPENMLTTMHTAKVVADKIDQRTNTMKYKPVCARLQ